MVGGGAGGRGESRDKQAADGAQTAATVCFIIRRWENTAAPHSDSVPPNEVAMRVCGHSADSIQTGEVLGGGETAAGPENPHIQSEDDDDEGGGGLVGLKTLAEKFPSNTDRKDLLTPDCHNNI